MAAHADFRRGESADIQMAPLFGDMWYNLRRLAGHGVLRDKTQKPTERKATMTNEQSIRCHAIIHSSAIAAGTGNVIPVPGLGVAADTAALAGMAMGLANVFGQSIPSSVAKAMAVDALKKTLLRQPIKVIGKELSKIAPVFGAIFSASVSVGLVEAAGWSLADEFERRVSLALN